MRVWWCEPRLSKIFLRQNTGLFYPLECFVGCLRVHPLNWGPRLHPPSSLAPWKFNWGNFWCPCKTSQVFFRQIEYFDSFLGFLDLGYFRASIFLIILSCVTFLTLVVFRNIIGLTTWLDSESNWLNLWWIWILWTHFRGPLVFLLSSAILIQNFSLKRRCVAWLKRLNIPSLLRLFGLDESWWLLNRSLSHGPLLLNLHI